MDLLIKGGTIVTMGNKGIIRDGAIIIEGDRIIDLGKAGEMANRYKGYERLDAKGKLIIPGLVNAHQHAAMSLLRGYADDLPLKEWLEEKIWPLEAHLKGYEIYVGALITAIESLLGGCTTINTMYHYLPDFNEARAFAEVGIRGAIGHVCFSWRMDEDRKALYRLAEEWHGKADGRIRVTVDPHSPYTVDPEGLCELLKICENLNQRFGSPELPIFEHIHLAETMDEPRKVEKAFGKKLEGGVVEYLDALGFLNSSVTAAHCVHLAPREPMILAKKGVKVVHCPTSNLKLGSGISPIPELLKANVTVALGTDGSCSNNSSDMFETMKLAALLHKGIRLDPTLMPAEEVLRMATIEGAKAVHWEGSIGSLEPGKKADIVIINLRKPHLTPMYSEISHLVYACKASDVDTVLVNGNIIVEDRRIKTIDPYKVMEMAEKAKEDLLARLRGLD
ncbi:amidohydrolase [Candidatus Bathyarchaeota archaeon]|nr:amidohydrolase [Candidatus Bathyarchaeota archaeon]